MTNNTKNPNDLLIALVGRSNVGKSALFNRLLNKNQSIVEDVIGTTRDLVEHQIDLNGQFVKLVDTGGWLELNDDMFQDAIRDSLQEVFNHASLILFVMETIASLALLNPLLMESKIPSSKHILSEIRLFNSSSIFS